jgi:hypothetical protein
MDEKEFELRQTELVLKEREAISREREVAVREREVSVKEKEGKTSKWLNPVVITIGVAAIGLFGNMLNSWSNNRAVEAAEHFRAQSNLVLSVIKTDGNEKDACKNLNFFVKIGWLDDPKGAVHNCETEGGAPTLPASSSGIVDNGGGVFGSSGFPAVTLWRGSTVMLTVGVSDADSHEAITDAKVDVERTNMDSLASISAGSRVVTQSSTTGATGIASLNSVYSTDYLTVSKDGYKSVTQPMSQLTNPAQLTTYVPIELHRVPKTKTKQ